VEFKKFLKLNYGFDIGIGTDVILKVSVGAGDPALIPAETYTTEWSPK